MAALGPTEREKRMLEQIEAERQAVEAEIRQQQEAKEKAEREQKEAERELREAEEERRRQAAVAQRAQDEHRQHEAKAKVAELTATKECSKKKIETAQHSQKQASQAIKAAEEKAKTVTKAEAQKRVAVEKQARYDEKANKIWEKWAHVNAFRNLCLEPEYQQILPKTKQVEFARYIKKSIQGEMTVARIQDTFRSHARNFLAGIRTAQKKKQTPLKTLEDLLKGWKSALAAAGQKTAQIRSHCEKHRLHDLAGFVALGMEEEISKVIAEFGETCDYFALNVECLNYTPPLQEKVIATV